MGRPHAPRLRRVRAAPSAALALILGGCVGALGPDPTPEPEPPRLLFSLPIADGGLISEVVGVDHDPEVHEGTLGRIQCTNYAGDGFPACYDEHDGTDYILDGGFRAMDAGSVAVVAAATGTVVEVDDAHYDRCHADVNEPSGVSCDGHPIVANRVVLEHEDPGSGDVVHTRYLHLMQDSAAVSEGEGVDCGDVLGIVGSSGRSSLPHLHFEVSGPDGDEDVVDPYAGPESQPESWWRVQLAEHGLPEPCP